MRKGRDGVIAEAPPVATHAELEQRIAGRPKPKRERHLTIEGWEEIEVHRAVDRLSENRIKALETRLNRARDKALQDHRLANVRGRAKADFERSH